ncbi:MAG: UDP-2,3-diacylglucosamine diphosphatase [Thiotrichales bacterium]
MNGVTLFVSDLHLAAERPRIVELFADFLRDEAANAATLFILGDLFEYWIGDDQPTAGLEPVLAGFESLAACEVPCRFVHGNRDFLLGAEFARRFNWQLLPESTTIDLYGVPTLLLHGDTLCTDDHEYQKMRLMLRDQSWQQTFLALPLAERVRQALALRERSMNETLEKSESIMDVNATAVEAAMRRAGVNHLIHGHTHRPGTHEWIAANGETLHRAVLGDWYQHGSVLRVSAAGSELATLS